MIFATNLERFTPKVPQQVEGGCNVPGSVHDPERTHIQQGDYTAEVLQGNNVAEPFWYYVLQRKDSPEILDLAKYNTFDEAIEGAKLAVGRMQQAAAAD